MSGVVYLLHFEPGLPNGPRIVRHYIGWTAGDVQTRLREHVSGAGSPLVAAVVNGGGEVTVARTWRGGRTFERSLKRRHEAPRLCPLCVESGHTRGRGLLDGCSPRAGTPGELIA